MANGPVPTVFVSFYGGGAAMPIEFLTLPAASDAMRMFIAIVNTERKHRKGVYTGAHLSMDDKGVNEIPTVVIDKKAISGAKLMLVQKDAEQ